VQAITVTVADVPEGGGAGSIDDDTFLLLIE
jgi:hypothetical protein